VVDIVFPVAPFPRSVKKAASLSAPSIRLCSTCTCFTWFPVASSNRGLGVTRRSFLHAWLGASVPVQSSAITPLRVEFDAVRRIRNHQPRLVLTQQPRDRFSNDYIPETFVIGGNDEPRRVCALRIAPTFPGK
jgi:hypothetical protein